MKQFKTICLLILLNLLDHTVAQNLNYIHYNTNNSKLPHDIVYRLRQDKAGFLWISTDDGLVRFDGTEMVAIEKGFASKYIIGTDEENGRVWVSTWKGGIYYLQGDSAISVNSPLSGLYTNSTNHIIVFNDLVITYAFAPYTVHRYDSTRKMLIPYSLKQKPDSVFEVQSWQEEYYQFIKTSNHHLYAYNNLGIFDIVNNKLKRIVTTVKPDYIWESPLGIIYYKKGTEIYRTDSSFSGSHFIYSIPVEKFGNQKPISFKVLPSGDICIGLESIELHNGNPVYFLINIRTGDVIDVSKEIIGAVLSADIIVDKEGGLWLSSDGRGLFHVFDYKYKQLNAFDNPAITDLMKMGKDSLFIGTKEGVYLYHNNIITPIKNPKYAINYVIRKLFITETGNLGIATGSQDLPSYVVTEHASTDLTYDFTTSLKNYSITVNPGSKNVLTDLRSPKKRTWEFSLFAVIHVDEDEENRLWIVTRDGLFYFHPDEGVRPAPDPELKNVRFNCLKYVNGEGLWLGTSKGLFLKPVKGRVQYWGINEGLTNVNVRCLYSENKSSLWIGTQNGLFNFRQGKFTIYKRRDGLIGDDVIAIARFNDKEIAVGSSKGITLFLLQKPVTEILPLLNIEELQVNGEEKDWKHSMEISYNSSISLKYRSVTFVYPELLTYAYRLHSNESWINTQNTSLVFTDLKPGNYELELKVKKYNTDFSSPVIISFTILAPWWKSVWFLCGICVVAVLLVYFLFRYQLKRQKQKAMVTLELAELKMKALQTQLNPHFISNALNTIQYFILTRDEMAANNYLGRFTDLTRLFLEVSRSRFISLKTELELLENYLSLEKLRFENKFDYSIEVEPDIDKDNTYLPGMLVQPFVENSINHGMVYLPKERIGLLSIRIKKSGEFLSITINDNGIGRVKAEELKKRLPKSYRSHSTDMIEELKQAYNLIPGCHINLEIFDKGNNESGAQGTCVYIQIKVNKELI
jgi:ligand-binding sensor domain-containing protein